MQQSQRSVEDVHEHRARNVAVIAFCRDSALDAFQIPVGQLVPHETSRGLGVLVQSQPSVQLAPIPRGAGGTRRTQGSVAFRNRDVETVENPPVGAREPRGFDVAYGSDWLVANLGQKKASDVPELRREIAPRRERPVEIARIEYQVRTHSHSEITV